VIRDLRLGSKNTMQYDEREADPPTLGIILAIILFATTENSMKRSTKTYQKRRLIFAFAFRKTVARHEKQILQTSERPPAIGQSNKGLQLKTGKPK
jgi:hypothetical protein